MIKFVKNETLKFSNRQNCDNIPQNVYRTFTSRYTVYHILYTTYGPIYGLNYTVEYESGLKIIQGIAV